MEITIAIIDDDQDDIDVLCDVLDRNELKCLGRRLTFTDSQEAVQIMTDPRYSSIPSHVFVDYNMPVVSGKDVVKALRNDDRYDGSIIAVVSTGLNETDASEFEKLGADFTFSKPCSMQGYSIIIERVLGL
jgi:CheY-like chemotaxis protein